MNQTVRKAILTLCFNDNRMNGFWHSDCFNKKAAHFSSFPVRNIREERGNPNEMKLLKQIFLILAITIGASMAAAAQEKDQKQRPPKEDPPKIVPGKKGDEEKPRENRPKEEEKNKGGNKKPQLFFNRTTGETEISLGSIKD